ncbi:SusC/RagA family TonB-linked outer membrane protein [Sphingobacterium sp. HJSM2_6]|uniref:SusC/RagA family TonB-linked outer membrane protein n=1 Tax=Sphingobacterium sp. HJSM2_6 TaxID=3366264 RepID=UPI003BD4B5C9
MYKKRLLNFFLASTLCPFSAAFILASFSQLEARATPNTWPSPIKESNFQQSIQGKVSNSAGPIEGATIAVKENPAKATSSNNKGEFSIDASVGQTLIITAIGHEKKEVSITAATLTISLTETSDNIDEIIVVGYGSTQKKESLTGSLSTVSGSKLRDVTNPSVENMLNGKAPGVYVAPGTGRPGARGGVVIRGQATLSGSTSPLWVINGVIFGNNPGDLNPDDIENIAILKDAASTSVYGSQGANGVIVVTTKTASSKDLSLSYSTKVGFNQLTNGNLQMMNGSELYDYYASFSNADVIKFPRWKEDLKNSNFDWWNLATRNGFTQNHNVSLNGGTEKVQSYLSLGYYNELGAVKGYDFDRYNVRLNTVFKPFSWLAVKPSLVGARRGVDDRQYSTTAMYSNLPWDSPYDENGQLVPHRASSWVNNASTNYLYDLQWNKYGNTNYELMGNLDFDVKITDWLTFSSVNNYIVNTYSSFGYEDPRSNAGIGVTGRLTNYRSEYNKRYSSQIFRFNKTWNQHNLNGYLGYEFNDYTTKTLDVAGTGFIPGFEVLDVVAKPEKTKGGISEWAKQSVLSVANYEYANKYLGQVSFRRDGASYFGNNNKYGNFFSIGAGWNIHNEEWFDVNWIDALKIRSAYGSVGNVPSILYPQYSLYSVSSASGYNEQPGALISQIGNPDLTWENTYTSGAGLEAAFLQNRLRLTVDYYSKDTKNILYAVPITGLVGVTSLWKNIGEMNNKGIEVSLGADIIRKDDLLWSLNVNVGHNVNKLTKLYPTRDAAGNYVVRPVIIGDGSNIAGSAQRMLEPGLPVDTYYMKEWAGVNPDNGLPLWYKVEKDADGNETARTTTSNYSAATFQKLGNAAPKLFGGFSTYLSYKAFDLNANFGYSIGGKTYNYFRQEYDSDGTYTDRNQVKLQDDWVRWEKPGDQATHPVAKYNNQDKGNSASSRYLEDNDFLRLRTLTLGYNLDLSKYHMKNVRLFLTGENLFTITNYSGVDPEMSINESTGGILGTAGPSIYPATRKFMFGFNVTF